MNNQITTSISELLVALLSITATAFGYIIKEQREKIKIIQNQLSEKKYLVYHEIYSVLFDLFKAQKGLDSNIKYDLAGKLMDIKKNLFIYAPDHIVKKFLDWNYAVNENEGNMKHILIYLELFKLIRVDMGNKSTKISGMEILRSIMKNEEEFEKFKLMLA